MGVELLTGTKDSINKEWGYILKTAEEDKRRRENRKRKRISNQEHNGRANGKQLNECKGKASEGKERDLKKTKGRVICSPRNRGDDPKSGQMGEKL